MQSPGQPQSEWSAIVQSRHLKIWANRDRDHRHQCASSENAELGLLMLLVSDRDVGVRLAAVENSRHTRSSLRQLCDHSDEMIRAAVVRHPGSDDLILKRLTEDPVATVATAARARLNELQLLAGSKQEPSLWDPESTAALLLGTRLADAGNVEQPGWISDQHRSEQVPDGSDLLSQRDALPLDPHTISQDPWRNASFENVNTDPDTATAESPVSTTVHPAEIGPGELSMLLSEAAESAPGAEQARVVLDAVPSQVRDDVLSLISEEQRTDGVESDPQPPGVDTTAMLLLGGTIAAAPATSTSTEPKARIAAEQLKWLALLQAATAVVVESDAPPEGLTTYDLARLLAAQLCSARPEWIDSFDDLVEALDLPVVGPTLAAIRREISKGMTPDELPVALGIREFWRESAQFGMTWRHYRAGWVSANERGTLPWPLALRLVRSFVGIPVVEEIEFFLAEQFDHWRMMRVYVNSYSFSDYLYALTNTDGTTLEWHFRTE